MKGLVRQFNRLANENKSLIQKALTSATGVGEALIPEHLEEIITNTIVRLAPEIAMITPRFDAQKFHEFNRLTALPAAGGAMGEGAVTPTRNGTYARASAQLKVVRRKGSVTNFLQDTSANYIDAAAAEMENHLQAHIYDMIAYMVFGSATGNQYSFNGLDYFIQTNRTNEALGGAIPTTLSFLDDMIDENLDRQGDSHRKAFLMSPFMISKVSQLLTNVRLVQGLSGAGLSTVEVPGGWRLAAYRDVPIIASGVCRPKRTMGTITVAGAGTGATITDDEYFFKVSVIDWNGESLASAEDSDTTVNADTLTVSWAAETGALFYKIYESLTTDTETLIRIIAAHTYDANGTITGDVTSIVFTVDPAPDASVPTALQSDVPLEATGGVPPEYIFLWDLDEFQGMGKLAYTNSAGSRFNGLVTMTPLAQTDDNLPFLVKTYAALIDSFEATSVVHRGLRVA